MEQGPIIVFGAHPDDVEIGMGGTIKRLANAGRSVYSVIATAPNQADKRIAEAKEAAAFLGVKEVIFLPITIEEHGFNRKTVGVIDDIINKLQPHSVFTHWIHDSHQDHVNLTKAIVAATRKNNFNVFMYEQTMPSGITPAAFRAQYVIDITPHIDDKIESIRRHKTQFEKNGDWWLEGIRGRAMYRGYQIMAKFGEAFEVIKIKEDTNLFS